MTIKLQGLNGVKKKLVKAEFFRSVSAGMRALIENRAATAAGSMGAINIYVDDSGYYRGVRYCFMQERGFITTRTRNSLKEWLKTELPLIGE